MVGILSITYPGLTAWGYVIIQVLLLPITIYFMIFLIISTVDPINDDSDTVEYVSIHILLLTYYLLLYHICDSYY